MRSSARSTRRVGKASAGHRAAWVVGGGVATAAIVAAILLWPKKASAAPPVLPAPTTTLTNLQQTAKDMNAALDAHGYVQADMPTYQAFQTAAGLKSDGYPGQGTYKALVAALASITPPVPLSGNANAAYTFANPPGFNGVTAPSVAQWYGSAGGSANAGNPVAQGPGGTNISPTG